MPSISSSDGWLLPLWIAVLVAILIWLLMFKPSPSTGVEWSTWDWATIPPRRPRGRAQQLLERRWIDALIGELTVGRDPIAALVIATESVDSRIAYEAWVAARMSGDVATALMNDRSELLRGVGACWLVAANSGAGLVQSLSALSQSARERERMAEQLQIAIAEPRAAAVVVALLPVVGLGMGSLLGAHPLTWLLSTTIGHLVILFAVVLEGAGCLWAWLIIRSAGDVS